MAVQSDTMLSKAIRSLSYPSHYAVGTVVVLAQLVRLGWDARRQRASDATKSLGPSASGSGGSARKEQVVKPASEDHAAS